MTEYIMTVRLAISAPDDVAARRLARIRAELIKEALLEPAGAVTVKLQELQKCGEPRGIKL